MGEQKVVFADLAAHLTKKGSAVDDKELASKTFVGKCIYDWDIERIGLSIRSSPRSSGIRPAFRYLLHTQTRLRIRTVRQSPRCLYAHVCWDVDESSNQLLSI